MSDWAALGGELAQWRAQGRTPELWWRDDDATALTPALERLLALSSRSGVPVAIAAIAAAAEPAMLEKAPCVLMHGCDHRNRAAAGEKKTEFPAAEGDAAALARLAAGRERLAAMAADRFLPVLTPPWNRLRESLVPRLPEAGLRALSRYGTRSGATAVREVNTHVDLVAWRGDRAFIGEAQALAAIVSQLAACRRGEHEGPIGLLTHHALHAADAWRFLERLFDETRTAGAQWPHPAGLFSRPV